MEEEHEPSLEEVCNRVMRVSELRYSDNFQRDKHVLDGEECQTVMRAVVSAIDAVDDPEQVYDQVLQAAEHTRRKVLLHPWSFAVLLTIFRKHDSCGSRVHENMWDLFNGGMTAIKRSDTDEEISNVLEFLLLYLRPDEAAEERFCARLWFGARGFMGHAAVSTEARQAHRRLAASVLARNAAGVIDTWDMSMHMIITTMRANKNMFFDGPDQLVPFVVDVMANNRGFSTSVVLGILDDLDLANASPDSAFELVRFVLTRDPTPGGSPALPCGDGCLVLSYVDQFVDVLHRLRLDGLLDSITKGREFWYRVHQHLRFSPWLFAPFAPGADIIDVNAGLIPGIVDEIWRHDRRLPIDDYVRGFVSPRLQAVFDIEMRKKRAKLAVQQKRYQKRLMQATYLDKDCASVIASFF